MSIPRGRRLRRRPRSGDERACTTSSSSSTIPAGCVGAISLEPLRRLFFDEEALRHLVVAADLLEPDARTRRSRTTTSTPSPSCSATPASPSSRSSTRGDARSAGRVDRRARRARGLSPRDAAPRSRGRRGNARDRWRSAARRSISATATRSPRSRRRRASTAARCANSICAGATRIQVLLLRTRTPLGETVRVPSADDRIAAGDRLVIAGHSRSLRAARRSG